MGLAIVGFFALMALLATWIVPYSPHQANFTAWQPPTWGHWLGTDDYGQDVLSQLIVGAQASLVVGVLAGLLSGLIGVTVGITAGYKGGATDEILMRLVDFLLVIPTLALMIVVSAFIPSSGQTTEIMVIGGLSWLWMARVVRSQVMSERRRGYVDAARVLGVSDREIMFREILPNVVPVIVANMTLIITVSILVQASLNFLGIGSPTAISWGSMLSLAFADNAIDQGAWWWTIPPGLCLTLLAYGFSLIGHAILQGYAQSREQ